MKVTPAEKGDTLIPLMAIIGPTAVGKSKLALEVARKVGGEIVSADSAQVYRYLDIGTAKPTPEELNTVEHHLINVVDPDEEFSVADYQKIADNVITEVYKKGKLPIICGGTGLYVKAVTDRYAFGPKGKNELLRNQLNKIAEEKGTQFLYEQLKDFDPVSADKIHPRDKRRTIRALEFYHAEGKRISEQQKETQFQKSRYRLLLTGLTMERSELYGRINERTERMIDNGLIQEVKNLIKRYPPTAPAMQILGYRQSINYLDGNITYEELVETIKKETRNYAKRQYTWFQRDDRIRWFDVNKIDLRVFVEIIYDFLKEYKI